MGAVSRGLLDTSVLIAQDDEPSFQNPLPDETAISVVSLAELHFGVLVAKNDAARQYRLRRLGTIESLYQPLPIDAGVARAYGTVAHAVRTAGRQPRARIMDLWIAATAWYHEIPLYTLNPEDFIGLENLIEVRAL
jgi:predicted nucleic acid-binding protein